MEWQGQIGDRLRASKTKQGIAKNWLNEYQALREEWRQDAVLYARQRLGLNPTWQQTRILEAITEPGAKVSIRSGHGIGKSASLSAAIWWKLECFDFAKVPCTAPSSSQLRDILWAELARWLRTSMDRARKWNMPQELWLNNMFEMTQDRVTDRGSPKEWFAVARTARPENPDALQGFHASNVVISDDGFTAIEVENEQSGHIMFVVEEAGGVNDRVFEVAEGALSSKGATLIMAGNPTSGLGYFANSHKKNRGEYKALHYRSSDSPLVAPGYREGLVRKFGENSNVVRVRADGDFPRADDDTLIPLELVEAAIYREPTVPSSGERRLGVDVARFGDDRTVFVLRQGANVDKLEIYAKLDNVEVAAIGTRLFKQWSADQAYIDTNGLGSGVYDLMIRQVPCLPVNVSAKAPERSVLPESRLGNRVEAQPLRLRDFLWLELLRWLREDEPSFKRLPRDLAEDLAGELSSVKFGQDSAGRIVIETKDAMKARGIRSCDLADGLGVSFYSAGVIGKGEGIFELERRRATERKEALQLKVIEGGRTGEVA